MTEKWKDEAWAQDIWYSGKVTRRRWSAMAAAARSARPCWCRRRGARPSARPSPTRSARCSRCRARPPPAARPRWSACRWRSTASTSPAASTAGRSRSIVADDESKPDVGRRKTEKLLVEDKVDVHVGGFLSNICLACMPVFEENKVVNMISVCLDTTLTTTQVQPLQLPALRLRAVAGGGVRALPRQQDGQEVAHRLRRLLLGPVDARRLRGRRSRRPAARSSAPPAFRSAPPT